SWSVIASRSAAAGAWACSLSPSLAGPNCKGLVNRILDPAKRKTAKRPVTRLAVLLFSHFSVVILVFLLILLIMRCRLGRWRHRLGWRPLLVIRQRRGRAFHVGVQIARWRWHSGALPRCVGVSCRWCNRLAGNMVLLNRCIPRLRRSFRCRRMQGRI